MTKDANPPRKTTIFAALTATVACVISMGSIQSFDGNTSTPPLVQIAQHLHEQFGPVGFQRDERWEERFLVRWSEVAFSERPHIFQVHARRFEISNGSVVERVPSGVPTMYVATSKDELSKVYKLAGFDGAEQEFNRMVSDSPRQEIKTTREAESRGLLCAELVYNLFPSLWVDGASSIQLKAADHFFNEGYKDGLQRAEQWWNKAKIKTLDTRIATQKRNSVFVLSLPVFWTPVETHSIPEVRINHIEVSSQGMCHLNEPAIVKVEHRRSE